MPGYVGGDPYQSPTFGKSLSLRVDGGFNAVSINPSGRDVVLASRQGLYVINLDDPFSPPRWVYDKTPWQVADVQWCPHPAKPYWVVSTSNQKAIIWNLARSSVNAVEYVLHGHSRAVTDITFNFDHPDLLATCSIDTYIHAWDMRSPNRPFYTTTDWHSGASQVQWNYKQSNILASAQGNDVCIWDLRMGSTPLYKLSDHSGSVNNIDFNKHRGTEIMTSSNDGTVKFWDYSKSSTRPMKTIRTNFPVWRGRYSPFGEGFLVMPTVGGGNSVFMQNLSPKDFEEEDSVESNLQPVYVFKGHTNFVTDFIWRSRHSYNTDIDDREFQLITWSKDCDLRLWPLTDDIYENMDFERGKRLQEKFPNYEYSSYNREPESSHIMPKDSYKARKEIFVTTSGTRNNNDLNHITWLSGVRMNHSNSSEDLFKTNKYQNLGEEVSAIGHKFPKIVFEKISVSTGELIITLNGPWSEITPGESIFLRIEVQIPNKYPSKGRIPIFHIEENSNLSQNQRSKIISSLKDISKKYSELNLYCLEPCIKFILGEEVDLNNLADGKDDFSSFDLADKLYFEDFSSLSSSDILSKNLSDLSSDSEDESFKVDLAKQQSNPLTNNMAGRDLQFDSTPVPNECGAVWSPTGQLFCFFTNNSSSNKAQNNFLKLRVKMNLKNNNLKRSELKSIMEDKGPNQANSNNEQSKNIRPKRYVDIIAASSNNLSSNNFTYSSDNDDSNEESSDEFSDDWGDILKNDLNFKTKFSTMNEFLPQVLTSLQSGSMKGLESLRKTKNCVIQKDFSYLIPDKRELALEYQFIDAHPEELARINASVSNSYGYDEISHCWQALSDLLMEQEDVNPYTLIWDNHPMGIRWFINQAIIYFESQNNLQMLAMLACVLANFNKDIGSNDLIENDNEYIETMKRVESVVTFSHFENNDSRFDSQSLHSVGHHRKTSSFSETQRRSLFTTSPDNTSIQSDDYFNFRASHSNHPSTYEMNHRGSFRSQRTNTNLQLNAAFQGKQILPIANIHFELIDDEVIDAIENPIHTFFAIEDISKLQWYQYQYSKLLFRWGLPIERAKLLKLDINSVGIKDKNNTRQNSYLNSKGEFYVDNQFLHTDNIGTIGINWRENVDNDLTFKNCVYCNHPADRSVFICGNCQHIMHPKCAQVWWKVDSECPSGCGCHCPDVFDLE
ncbi:hypothetical protein TBLA_0D04020 [Henningerozyma blattae CBS 6284]|uniref:RWD domain-containing protein n=1 Tax=Henningerozyma blattae (strain ATCC 34711 / CBS 6284 / DSM 70876 / NBRC 10599 / NRRL Y-10934 / UCD 77-7) TaxID=1071380 RepID=I2H3E7_HENB6|nr:hypothetical protein TBLA_0D04020 [Tetrapisispora blattae CBS 6284]CCH60899.1 hypothetical protein TBLA_0D04020 [Tetrapisispora blattae CBS 6284]